MRRPRSRKLAATAASFMAAALVLAACSSGDDELDDGVLRLAVSAEGQSLDPALQESGGDMRLRWHAIYDRLLHCDKDGTVVPNAAQEWDLNDDATELTMVLRDGMTFSDGSPVDSAAVKASIEHMRDSGGSDAGRVAGAEIDTPDDRTVILRMPEPTGQLPTFMCLAPGAIAHPEQIENGEVGSRPHSSGPYELDRAGTTSGSVYRFTKREDYWDADSYSYDVVELITMTEPTARLNAITSGQVSGAILTQDLVDQAQLSGVHVITFPGAWAGLYLNDREGTEIPALGDVRVRRAINMVFDRQALAEHTYGQGTEPSTQVFNPNATANLPELDERYPYDVQAAQDLMEEAGYADGFTVRVPSQSGGSANFNAIISQQLGLLNIDVVEVPLTGPTALNDILGGEFPIMYARMGTADSLFNIVELLGPDSIWNVMGNEDPNLQPLLDEAQVAQGDEAIEVYQEINEYIVDQAWFAPWVADSSYYAVSDEELVPEITDPFNFNPYLSDFQ